MLLITLPWERSPEGLLVTRGHFTTGYRGIRPFKDTSLDVGVPWRKRIKAFKDSNTWPPEHETGNPIDVRSLSPTQRIL